MTEVAAYTPNVAVVTGAAQGIGKTIALRLADDGFDLALADLATQQDKLDGLVNEILSKGRKAISVQTDVTKEQDVMFLIERTVHELGGVDVVSNSASSRFGRRLIDCYAYLDDCKRRSCRALHVPPE